MKALRLLSILMMSSLLALGCADDDAEDASTGDSSFGGATVVDPVDPGTGTPTGGSGDSGAPANAGGGSSAGDGRADEATPGGAQVVDGEGDGGGASPGGDDAGMPSPGGSDGIAGAGGGNPAGGSDAGDNGDGGGEAGGSDGGGAEAGGATATEDVDTAGTDRAGGDAESMLVPDLLLPGPCTDCDAQPLVLFDGVDLAVYRSDDEGRTWRKIGTVPVEGPAKVSMVVRGDGTFVATTTRGEVLLSNDDGVTWHDAPDAPWGSDGPPSATAPDGTIANDVTLVIGPMGVMTALSTHSLRDSILYRSTNGGIAWERRGDFLLQTGADSDLAVDGNGRIYVSTAPSAGARIYRSDDGGRTATMVGSYTDQMGGGVAIMEVDAWGTVYAAGFPETTFYVSEDRAASFVATGTFIDGRSIQDLAIDQRDHMFGVSVKGPVIESTDAGATWAIVGDWGEAEGIAPDRNISGRSGWISLSVIPPLQVTP